MRSAGCGSPEEMGKSNDNDAEETGEAGIENVWLDSGNPDEIGKAILRDGDEIGDSGKSEEIGKAILRGVEIGGNEADKPRLAEPDVSKLIEAGVASIESVWLDSGSPDEISKSNDTDAEETGEAEIENASLDSGNSEEIGKSDEGSDIAGDETEEASIDNVGLDNGSPDELGNARLRDSDDNEIGGTEADKARLTDPDTAKLVETGEASIENVWLDSGNPEETGTSNEAEDTVADKSAEDSIENAGLDNGSSDETGKSRLEDADNEICGIEADKGRVAELDTSEFVKSGEAEVKSAWLDNGSPDETGKSRLEDADNNEICGNEVDKANVAELDNSESVKASEAEIENASLVNGSPDEIGNAWSVDAEIDGIGGNEVDKAKMSEIDDTKFVEAGEPRPDDVTSNDIVPTEVDSGADGKIKLDNAGVVEAGTTGADSVCSDENSPDDGPDTVPDRFKSRGADTDWLDGTELIDARDSRPDDVTSSGMVPDRMEAGTDGKLKLDNAEVVEAGTPGTESVGSDERASDDGTDDTVPDRFKSNEADKNRSDDTELVNAGKSRLDDGKTDGILPDITESGADGKMLENGEVVKARASGMDGVGSSEEKSDDGPVDTVPDISRPMDADKLRPSDAEAVSAGELVPENIELDDSGSEDTGPDSDKAGKIELEKSGPIEVVPDITGWKLETEAENTCSEVGSGSDVEAPDNKVLKPDSVLGSCKVDETNPDDWTSDDGWLNDTGDTMVVKVESGLDDVGPEEASPAEDCVSDDTATSEDDRFGNTDSIDARSDESGWKLERSANVAIEDAGSVVGIGLEYADLNDVSKDVGP
ncbi:hypothetical protein E4U55_005614 [Claviceps digitariae]|nr:hypothetical protein E4U55_005614 [Claviceps digitariae]